MSPIESFGALLRDGYTLDVSRYLDAPLGPKDRLLATDNQAGKALIARAPIQTLASTSEFPAFVRALVQKH